MEKTFFLSDFFLKIDSEVGPKAKRSLERFFDAILKASVITPTIQERAMNAAHNAALNSACLSRQVGAVITDKDGIVLGTGWNDVPKAHGGLYGNEDAHNGCDHRCAFKDELGCQNDLRKEKLAKQIALVLADAKIVKRSRTKQIASAIEDSDLKNLIEFSRAVHAEMHALINAGKNSGQKIQGGLAFVTTFPCHSCARHLVAAGIREIYYIEPYKKSLALTLHGDALSEDEGDLGKVFLKPFEGVAPRRYRKTFEMIPDSRKGDGAKASTSTGGIAYRSGISLESIPVLENAVVNAMPKLEP